MAEIIKLVEAIFERDHFVGFFFGALGCGLVCICWVYPYIRRSHEKEMKGLDDDKDRLRDDKQRLKEDNERLNDALKDARVKHDDLLESRSQERKESEAKTKDLSLRLGTTKRKLAKARIDHDRFKQKADELQTANESLSQEIERLKNGAEILQNQLSSLKAGSESELMQSRRELTKLQTRFKEQERLARQANEEKSALGKDIDRLKAELSKAGTPHIDSAEVKDREKRLALISAKLAESEAALEKSDGLVKDLQLRLTSLQQEFDRAKEASLLETQNLRAQKKAAMMYRDRLQQEAAELCDKLAKQERLFLKVKEERDSLSLELESSKKQNQRSLDLDPAWLETFNGKIWDKPPIGTIPFIPKADRQVRIISVVNLKGGVGKTTITANLGATLVEKGKRVLLVDLDYQGSLTSLCLNEKELDKVRKEKKFMEELFRKRENVGSARLWASSVQGKKNFDLIATEEELSDVETQLMVQWFFQGSKSGQEDVRYKLRKLFHTPDINEAYDFVFLDCPPRLTTACINALTCSDYVLIPVIPDRRSTEAVPRLLNTLSRLGKSDIFPDLSVLGIVANRTFGSFTTVDLTNREKQPWNLLPGLCREQWRGPIHYFSSCIKQFTNEADESARTHRFVIHDAAPKSRQITFRQAFDDLAEEVLRIIPS